MVAKAGCAVLSTIVSEDLVVQAALMGDFLQAGLRQLQDKYAIIGDIRGLGLMVGVELVIADGEPAVKETDAVLEKMKDKGYIIGKGGQSRNVLVLMPPLIIGEEEITGLLKNLDNVLKKTYVLPS